MDDEDFCIECSDDESPIKKGIYEPPPEDIEKYYELLDQGIIPELKWESPGYRPPTPMNLPTTPTHEEDPTIDEKSDFDFMDEMNSPRLPVRRDGEAGPKGSAKKKTTSLDGVLSNMRRHWRLDQQMMDNNGQTKSNTNNSNPPTPVTVMSTAATGTTPTTTS